MNIMSGRRAASIKTRIETRIPYIACTPQSQVAGRHPSKQGLKPHIDLRSKPSSFVAGRHPSKQGLKLEDCIDACKCGDRRRAASIKTRIETRRGVEDVFTEKVSQGGIHQNKDWNNNMECIDISICHVAGRHPSKQGLKLRLNYDSVCSVRVAGRHPSKQGLKHKSIPNDQRPMKGRRAASIKTRIETLFLSFVFLFAMQCRRAASIKTRIETPF